MAAIAGAMLANIAWAPHPGSQALLLSCPVWECLVEGPRGGGKTDGLVMDFAQHCGVGHGPAWRGILFRRTFPELVDVITKTKRWLPRIFPRIEYNESSHTWTWPTGEQLLLRYMARASDYWSYHGHEYPWIGWEELCAWPSLDCYDAMKSCSRASVAGMPRKIRSTANPYGPGHNAVKMRFIDPGPPGTVIRDREGNTRVRLRSHWSENKALLAADPDYPKRLAADRNVNRRKAWLLGDWDIVAGGMFDDVWDRDRHVLKPFPIPASWRIDRAYDHGSSRPFSVGWWAESDGTPIAEGVYKGRVFPRGSVVRVGEWYGWDGENPNVGLKMIDVNIARGIREREGKRFEGRRVLAGPADASIFFAEPGHLPLSATFSKERVPFEPSDKRPGSRKTGWETMRRLLAESAKDRPEAPGLWVVETCTEFIRTVPVLPRDEKDPDDVDTEAEDHIADEARYRVTGVKREARTVVHRV